MGRREGAHSLLKVDAREERVSFHLGGVLAEPLVRSGAQRKDEVSAFRGEGGLRRDVKAGLPVDHLVGGAETEGVNNREANAVLEKKYYINYLF